MRGVAFRIVVGLIVFWLALSASAQAITINGVRAFKESDIRALTQSTRLPLDVATALQRSYLSSGYFDVAIQIDVSGDTTIVVTEGHRYRLEEIDYVGVADSITGHVLKRVGGRLPATESNVAKLSEATVLTLADAGYPYAVVGVDSLVVEPVRPQLFLTINPGPQVSVAEIKFHGLRLTRPRVLYDYLEVAPGDSYSESDLRRSNERLKRLDFARSTGEPAVIFRPREKDVTLLFSMKEARNFSIDGLGYLTPDNELAGNVKSSLRNIFGYGERFRFDWSRANRSSSQIVVAASVPRMLASPLDGTIELRQHDRDSSFVATSATASLAYHLNFDWLIAAGLTWSKVAPEEELLTNAARVLAIELRTDYDSRDDRRRPRAGLVVTSLFQTAYRREFPLSGGVMSGYSRRFDGSFALYHSLSRSIVLLQRLKAFQAASDFDPLPLDELVEVGGPASLRGYRDNSFLASLGAISNSELRWLALDNLTLLAFVDNAVIRASDSDLGLTGFGGGLLIDTSLGEFRFEAALGEEKTLDRMLVHFGFSGEF